MTEKNQVFSSKLKSVGIFSFADFYKFCHDYLTEELEFGVAESKYKEKLSGDSKEIDIEWKGEIKISDYFKYEIKVEIQIRDLTSIEAEKEGKRRRGRGKRRRKREERKRKKDINIEKGKGKTHKIMYRRKSY